MGQSNISKENVTRLRTFAHPENQMIVDLATIVLKVAEVKPHKKMRLKVLSREHRKILATLEETGLIIAHHM